MSDPVYEARRADVGWCVIGPDFYVYFRDRAIAEALAALLNRDLKSAAEWAEQWRSA